MYTCANCAIHACKDANHENMPKNCPVRQEHAAKEALAEYQKPEIHNFYIISTILEKDGYCRWPRLKETMEFCKRMEYKKVGLGFCVGLYREAKVVADLLRAEGLEVVSVVCKAGGIDKGEAGVPDEKKLNPGQYEAMCNPILQAKLLNSQNTEFNIALGLCVGHDSLFCRYSDAMVTTLVAKDRALAHNPAGAIYCAEGYFKKRLEE
ncbi:MAG: DUF1847 domain-containing protein [Lachnospiraceae bacterium]|nr:DUF1847 domain-containing protein [Lachnospiraceae bacterium]